MNLKRLNLHPCDEGTAKKLSEEAGIPMLLAMTLVSRGVTDAETAADYLNTGSALLQDAFQMLGMRQAVDIILDVLAEHCRIAVYGDYDVDGITATCVLFSTLKSLGADCIYYIPNRLTEGYGLHQEALRYLIEDEGAALIVTVDTGITAVDEVRYCKERGVRIVVTDHHECPAILPEADAVVDPRNPLETYPFCHLAGVGVAFKLAGALLGNQEEALERFADLVSLGTVADVMPLYGENRAIVSRGLQKLRGCCNIGLRALCLETGIVDNRPISAATLSFLLAPRINAAGRFEAADRAAQLFLTESPAEAAAIAGELSQLNLRRQTCENNMLAEAEQVLRETCDPENDRVFVLWHRNWHHGILGIVASRLTDRYARPVILLSVDGDVCKGSGRSIKGFNLYDALAALPTRPVQFGGHELAAGLTLETDKLEAFRADLRAYAAAHLDLADCVPTLEVDCAVEPKQLTLDAVASLSLLEPTGMGNPEPLFYLDGLVIREIAPIGNGKHSRIRAEGMGVPLNCVFFGRSPEDLAIGAGDIIEIAANAQINDFRGKSVQLLLREARLAPHERQRDEVSRALYGRFRRHETLKDQERACLYLRRQELVAIWKFIAASADAQGNLEIEPAYFHRELRRQMKTPISWGKLLIALDVFSELHLLYAVPHGDLFSVSLISGAPKANLANSPTLALLGP